MVLEATSRPLKRTLESSWWNMVYWVFGAQETAYLLLKDILSTLALLCIVVSLSFKAYLLRGSSHTGMFHSPLQLMWDLTIHFFLGPNVLTDTPLGDWL